MKRIGITEDIIRKLDDNKELLYEMSNIHEEESGLKTMLHLYYNGEHSGLPHGNRVKVQLSDKELFPIKVNKKKNVIEPINENGEFDRLNKTDKKIVQNAILFIEDNIDMIEAYWQGKFKEPELHKILAKEITLEDAIKKYNK